MPMQNHCSVCRSRPRSKMASAYMAWTWPTGDRRAFKQLLCVECAAPLARKVTRSSQGASDCTVCGLPFEDSDTAVTVWITAYFPHRERMDCYAEYHARCFEKDEPNLREGAVRLADRGSERGAPRPDLEADPWEALGLVTASVN